MVWGELRWLVFGWNEQLTNSCGGGCRRNRDVESMKRRKRKGVEKSKKKTYLSMRFTFLNFVKQ